MSSPAAAARRPPLSASVTMTKISVGPMDNNAYLLQSGSGATVLIDAANDSGRLLELIGGRVADTITTHRHGDHWQALPAVAEATGARLVGGRPDVDAIARGQGRRADRVWDGDQVELGDESLEVIGLVGHTPVRSPWPTRGADGAVTFHRRQPVPRWPGQDHSPADFTSLMDDLEAKVFARFDDDTVVHPGHGDDTTLGAERPHLEEWRQRGW